MKYYCEDAAEVLRQVDSSSEGLTSGEAAKRLERDGRNELAAEKKDSLLKRFFAQMADPMIIILIVAAAISAVTGIYEEGIRGITDTVIILIVVLVNSEIARSSAVYQESKAEKAIEALQAMSAATSKVLRDREDNHRAQRRARMWATSSTLRAGDAVPADGRIIDSAQPSDRGRPPSPAESVPVYKFIDIIDLKDSADVPTGRPQEHVLHGLHRHLRPLAPWSSPPPAWTPEMGKIADALARARGGPDPAADIKLSQLSKILTWLVLGICVVIFGVQIAYRRRLLRRCNTRVVHRSPSPSPSLRFPEGLAAVVTVVLSIGVTNMSKRNAIIRRLTAVETLGLRADNLLRQDRHAHPEQDDRRGPLRRGRKASWPGL